MDVSEHNTPASTSAIDSVLEQASIPVIEFLSGRFRGTHQKVTEQAVFLAINEFGGISVIPASEAIENEDYPIRLEFIET